MEIVCKSENSGVYYNNIIVDGRRVGELNYVDNGQNIFIMFVGIDDNYKRCGYATQAVDLLFTMVDKDVSLHSMDNESAQGFWKKYLSDKDYEEVKPNTFVISNFYKENEIENC